MVDIKTLLVVVQPSLDGKSSAKVADMLFDRDVRAVAETPSREEIGELLPTLLARQTNAQRSGTTIYGLDALIARLELLPRNTVVLGYGFVSPNIAGNLYVDPSRNVGLGAAVVDR